MKETMIKLVIAIVAFSLTVAVIVGSITFSRSSEFLQKEIESNTQYSAEKYANQLSAAFNHMEGLVDSMAAVVSTSFNPELLAQDIEYMEEYKEEMKGIIARTLSASTIAHGIFLTFNPELTPNDDEVWYSYQNGEVAYVEAQLALSLRFNDYPVPEQMQYFYLPIETGKAVWTGPYDDMDLGINMLTYSKPIYIEDLFVGVTGADVTTADTTDIIKSMHPYDKGYAVLLNEQLEFIIPPPDYNRGESLEAMISQEYDRMASALAENFSGNLHLQVDGEHYITGYSHLNNGWSLAIFHPRKNAFAPIHNLNQVLLALGGTVFLLILIFSILFSFSFSRPISIRQSNLEAQNREKDILLAYQSRQAKIGEMVGNIAHQWKQPLNSINLVLTNIMDSYRYGELDENTLRSRIHKAEDIIHNMSDTISDFTGFLKPTKEKEHFDVHDSMAMALSLMEESLHQHNIKICYSKENSCVAYGYANEFAHVLFNIIGNARDAIVSENPPEKQIDILVRHEDYSIFVQVVNRWCKIEEDVLVQVFNPYFTTKEEKEGTGIGLYISKVIIEQRMKGRIWLKNIQEGVSCEIMLPRS